MSKLFIQTLAEINAGKLVEELTDQLAELVQHCSATGKVGSLTLKLKLKPAKGSAAVIHLEHDVSVKIPEFERPADFFFVGKGNDLLREDPRQQKLDLKAVPVRQTAAEALAAQGDALLAEGKALAAMPLPAVQAPLAAVPRQTAAEAIEARVRALNDAAPQAAHA